MNLHSQGFPGVTDDLPVQDHLSTQIVIST